MSTKKNRGNRSANRGHKPKGFKNNKMTTSQKEFWEEIRDFVRLHRPPPGIHGDVSLKAMAAKTGIPYSSLRRYFNEDYNPRQEAYRAIVQWYHETRRAY